MKKKNTLIGIVIILLFICCAFLWNQSYAATEPMIVMYPALETDGSYSLTASTTNRITDRETVETILYILTTAEPCEGSAPDAVGDIVLGLSDPTNATGGQNVTFWLRNTVFYSPGQQDEQGLYSFSDAHSKYLRDVLAPFLKNS